MTAPRLVVDAASGLAPWRQIHDQLTALVDGGVLDPGTRLPPIRRLARDLGVAPGTVARAYRELEASGRVRTARGGGTVVGGPAPGAPDRLLAAAADYLAAAKLLGADPESAIVAIRTVAGSDAPVPP